MERNQNNSTNNSTSPSQIIDSKLAMYWERFAIYIACSLVALCAWLYVKQEEKIAQLDVKVQQLQIDKVSKQELREMEKEKGGVGMNTSFQTRKHKKKTFI